MAIINVNTSNHIIEHWRKICTIMNWGFTCKLGEGDITRCTCNSKKGDTTKWIKGRNARKRKLCVSTSFSLVVKDCFWNFVEVTCFLFVLVAICGNGVQFQGEVFINTDCNAKRVKRYTIFVSTSVKTRNLRKGYKKCKFFCIVIIPSKMPR